MPRSKAGKLGSLTAILMVSALATGVSIAGAKTLTWTKPEQFSKHSYDAPRVAVGSDGTVVMIWLEGSNLLTRTRMSNGKFTDTQKLTSNIVGDMAVAAGKNGKAAIAWPGKKHLYVAIRTSATSAWKTQAVATDSGESISGAAIAEDPQGGWVVAERQFKRLKSDSAYRLRALSIDSAGHATPVQELGTGYFGIDARSTFALTVSTAGQALLAADRESTGSDGITGSSLFVRPHGGTFTERSLPGKNAGGPVVVAGPNGSFIASWTDVKTSGDAGDQGIPTFAFGDTNGNLGNALAPNISHPSRTFDPSAALMTAERGVLVWQQKPGYDAFNTLQPVRAAVVTPQGVGTVQQLTQHESSEPVALAIGDRALCIWSEPTFHKKTKKWAVRWRTNLTTSTGAFREVGAPAANGPDPYHFNETNRDIRSAGKYVAAVWTQDGDSSHPHMYLSIGHLGG